MKNAHFTMLYTVKPYLTIMDVRQIIQASVFAADQILLSTTLSLAQVEDEKERAFIHTKLRELHEIGAVRFWAVEGQSHFLQTHYDQDRIQVSPDIVIPSDVYNELYEEVIDRLMEHRMVFLGGQEAISFDGLAEIVFGKQELWRFAIAETLGANRLLSDKSTINSTQRFFADLLRYVEFEAQIIERIAEKLSLPDVSVLNTSEIERCRKFMPAFRERLLQETDGRYHKFLDERLIERISNAVTNEYMDRIEKLARETRHPARDLLEEFMWDLLELMFAPSIAVKYAQLFTNWIKKSREEPSYLLLLELRGIRQER